MQDPRQWGSICWVCIFSRCRPALRLRPKEEFNKLVMSSLSKSCEFHPFQTGLLKTCTKNAEGSCTKACCCTLLLKKARLRMDRSAAYQFASKLLHGNSGGRQVVSAHGCTLTSGVLSVAIKPHHSVETALIRVHRSKFFGWGEVDF